MSETAEMYESALRDSATGIADVLRDAVLVLGHVPDSLAGVGIYSGGQWIPLERVAC